MRQAPLMWDAVFGGAHIMETRVDIAGVTYYEYGSSHYAANAQTGLWSLTTTGAAFESFSIGGCYSASCNLVILNPAQIPKMAKIEVWVRLVGELATTEWIRKGVFYIDTREWDAAHEFLTITAYDAMLMADRPYISAGDDVGTWPKTDSEVVAEICDKLGLSLDDRTELHGYEVQLPAVYSDGSESDTVRDVLGWIAAMNCGNWVITDEGKLRLLHAVPPAATNYLVTEDGDRITFGGVRIIV